MNGLKYWKVLVCFGTKQTEKVLENPHWRDVFPDVFQGLAATDLPTKGATIIPNDIVRAIAEVQPYENIFGFQGNILRTRTRPEEMPDGYELLTPLEALERFGGECMRQAVDYGSVDINKCESSS